MPSIRPIQPLVYARAFDRFSPAEPPDLSSFLAPPYDVLDESAKQALLARNPHNIVAVDLPYTPPKTVGPAYVYEQAGQLLRRWLDHGILNRRPCPAVYLYCQNFDYHGRHYGRRSLIAAVQLPPPRSASHNSPALPASSGIWTHEQTFPSGREDRLRLMQACRAQTSPVFGIVDDPQGWFLDLLSNLAQSRSPDFQATTSHDQVHHQLWECTDPQLFQNLQQFFSSADIYIADGHHRFAAACEYRDLFLAHNPSSWHPAHPANFCLFVLTPAQDPALLVLPTHRILGGMPGFSWQRFVQAATPWLNLQPFPGPDLETLEQALVSAGPHALGLYLPDNPAGTFWIATPLDPDPLARLFPQASAAWRALDVAIVQHILVERICQPAFCPPGQALRWQFPHTLDQVRRQTSPPDWPLALILKPPPLPQILAVSRAGELMPQKSTFFYPKLATGLVIYPLE